MLVKPKKLLELAHQSIRLLPRGIFLNPPAVSENPKITSDFLKRASVVARIFNPASLFCKPVKKTLLGHYQKECISINGAESSQVLQGKREVTLCTGDSGFLNKTEVREADP